jgi:hypothetical protein
MGGGFRSNFDFRPCLKVQYISQNVNQNADSTTKLRYKPTNFQKVHDIAA